MPKNAIVQDMKMVQQDVARIDASMRRWRSESPKGYDKREHFIAGFRAGYIEALKDLAKREE
jgi:hypothetical protein